MTLFVWNKTVIGWGEGWPLRLRSSMVYLSPATQLLMYYVKFERMLPARRCLLTT